MAPPIITRPSFLLSHSLSSESFHKPLSLSIRGQRENHNHRKLTKLIRWTTALSNLIKLWAMPCRSTQDGQVMVESSDKTWPTGEGNDKPLQYSCLENRMNSMKRQKDMTLKNELPRLVGGEITLGRMKRQSESKNNAQLWVWLAMEVKSDAVQSNTA